MEDCLRRGDAAKLDLLLGDKDLEVRRHRIYIGKSSKSTSSYVFPPVLVDLVAEIPRHGLSWRI